MFYYYYDWTYILVLIGVVLSLLASAKVKSTFARYSNVRSYSGMTGRDAAEKILHRNGIYDVQIIHISGNLTDHYNPTNKTLALSDPVYHSTSVAAIGVAAHECGHAVQHQVGYAPLSVRSALVPAANFGSMISWPLIIIGLMFNGQMSAMLINLGILLFSLAVLFQIVTLPVEFNASHRAVNVLETAGMLHPEEISGVKKVLGAAALTYVATMVVQIPSPMQGYVNLGDCCVLLSGWILGPWWGGAAAGIGSMLTDLLNGYAHYAPGTLVIKALDAMAAALIVKALGRKPYAYVVGGVVGELIMVAGYFGYACLLLGKGIGAAASIPGNLMQGAMGLVIGLVLFVLLKRSKALDKLNIQW